MIILIAYVGIEGQSKKIAEAVASQIEKIGDTAQLFNVMSADDCKVLQPLQAAVLCAPIHGGRYVPGFIEFVRRERSLLNSVPSAFVSISLLTRDAREEGNEDVSAAPQALANETGWSPGRIYNATGGFHFAEHDFFKRWIAKRLVKREADGAVVGRDFEFSDWVDLENFVSGFVAEARV